MIFIADKSGNLCADQRRREERQYFISTGLMDVLVGLPKMAPGEDKRKARKRVTPLALPSVDMTQVTGTCSH